MGFFLLAVLLWHQHTTANFLLRGHKKKNLGRIGKADFINQFIFIFFFFMEARNRGKKQVAQHFTVSSQNGLACEVICQQSKACIPKCIHYLVNHSK